MDEAEILDWNPLIALNMLPEPDEEIVWSGQPDIYSLIPGMVSPTKLDHVWGFYYLAIFVCVVNSINFRMPWLFVAALVVIFFVQVLPFAYIYLKVSRMAYVVTSKRIIIKDWQRYAEQIHVLKYDDFQHATAVLEYPGTFNGTVYLMTGKDVGFWTFNILHGEQRQHPTLECVPHAEKLVKKIEAIRLEKIREKRPKNPF